MFDKILSNSSTDIVGLNSFLLKQFQSESGYNDVFIPAMQRLSPAYREYHKSLQAANEVFMRHFQQE